MGSSEWEGLLERRLAVLPGSRDPGGGPILIIPLPQDPSNHDSGAISATVKYLKTIPSVSARERGWVVVVDARVCHYRLVKPTVSTVRATLGYIRHLFVVRPEGFWDKQRVDCRKSEVDSQPIYVSVSKLTRHMEVSQLLVELGGTLDYDHTAWLKTRKAYEEFVDECERARRDLETLQVELRREEPCSRASTLHDLLSVNTNTYNTITARPSVIFNMGQDVLKVLEMDEESGFRVCEGQGDSAEAASRVRAMLHDLHLLTTAVEACWRRLNTALDTYMQVRELEDAMNDIGQWLVSAGQTLLAETSIGTITAQAEALLREHEAIELKCRETYGRWAGLRYKVDDALDRGDGDLRSLADHRTTTTDLRSLKDYTDTLVRTFASRLDRRRTLILASVRFHRIAQQMCERCSVLLQAHRWLPHTQHVDTLKKTLRELTARKEAIDYLASEGTRAGEKLLDLLTVGVKDLCGRDVTPDYTAELNHVHALLTAQHEHYARAARQADLHKLRLQQNIQLLTCQRDVKQAHKWLKALLEALVKVHAHVGRSSEEIRRLKTEHQQFQETAAGTFEYGYESARAALLVEKSAGGNVLSESRAMVGDLEDVWKMFVQGSQEQLTRLRVAGVFFRTMEQHLERLDGLCAGVVEKMSGCCLTADPEARNLFTSRDRLLREIGRNVRLGKLLKERLSDPLVPNFNLREHNENLLAQESISERIQHITNRAQQLDALMFPSATATPTPQARPDTEHEGSGSTEYWTCSECTCTTSGTYHTCPECQQLQELFTHDDTRPPSEEDLPLDEILKRRSRSRTKSSSKSNDDLAKVEPKRRSRSRSRSRSTPRALAGDESPTTSTATKVKKDAPRDHPDAIERATRSRSRSRSKSLTREIVASFKEFRDKVKRGRSRSKSGERKRAEEEEAAAAGASQDHEGEGMVNGDVRIPVQVQPQEASPTPAKPEKAWKEVSSETVTTRLVLHGGDSQGDTTLTLEHVTSVRKPDETRDTQTLRDAFRWKCPPPSAADSSSHRSSTSAQPKTDATETCDRAFTSSVSSQLANTPVPTLSIHSPVSTAICHDTPLVEASSFGLPSCVSPSSVTPLPQDANEDSSIAQISQAPSLTMEHGVCVINPTEEEWPPPPDQPPPEEPTLIQVRSTESPTLRNVASKLISPAVETEALPSTCPDGEEEELPPPRPPTPTLEVDEAPPPRPPEPTEVYEDIVPPNMISMHETTPPRPLPPTTYEVLPPRPAPPALHNNLVEEMGVCPPPRPDPPSDDADDEREMTPPRPRPPVEYEIVFPPRPPLPTILEYSPTFHEGSPVLEELPENTKNEATPPWPKAPIIKQFTPPRPTEADMATLPSSSLPPPSEELQQQTSLVPVEVTPENSSPSDHPSPSDRPYTSSSPEKSGTSPEKESDGEIGASPVTDLGRVGVGRDVTDQTSQQPSALPPPFPYPKGGEDEIIRKMRKSAEWLELRVVELTPGMVYLGANLEEATQLLHAHEEVLTKLQNKQSPVEDLLNQADQLISTQHPRAEVYASMAESLGLAWKDLNAQLETRKQILDMGVAFHTRAQQYSDSMDAAERAYTDNVMPSDAEGVRQLLSSLHDHKRAILEASMYTLQEAQALLARLRGLSTEGATLDSRPLHIKTNIEFACSQIEHYLESLHDRRRFLDGLFSARKHHLEQCLALCILYQDLTEAVTALKQLRDEVSQHQGLGESQSNAEILYHEHIKREVAAKGQQDRCIRLLKTAENMASGGHYAGLEARSRAYSVLEAATALHETCDTRTALLQQAILFFRLAHTALTKLDQAEVQVAGLGGEGSQRLSLVLGVVEEAVQPALTEGYAILEVTGGRNQPHNMGISLVVEELERRRSNLSSICVSSTEQVLQRTELSNAFLEQYNTIESWLVRIGDAFLQGHQDPGGSLSLAKDFLHLHETLNRDVMEKKNEIDALSTFLDKLLPDLSAEEGIGYQEKMHTLQEHWNILKKLLDIRIVISDKYVKFHEEAEAVNNAHEELELLLKEAEGEDRGAEVEAKWEQVQKLYLDLCNTGKAFCQDVRSAEDPYLDSNRAVLCVESILEHLGKRRLVITDLHSHFHMKITTTKEMMILWKTYKENVSKMQSEMSQMETDFCPLLRGNPADPEGMASTLEQRLNIYVSAVKKTQEDIQNMMTRAEVMSYKGDDEGQRDEVIGALLQLYQNLQNKATEYQILGHMLIQWCRNIAEIHRSCDKLESQFSNVSLDIGGVEGQLREHEASKQAVLELMKFAQNEADSIVSKIRDQCPPEAGAQDMAVIEEMLKRRSKEFDMVWLQHQNMLERQLRRSQYHVDLQVISDQLRDLSEQLSRMRGHYGDSLAAATNMQSAFNQFLITVDMLENRIHTFVTTTTKMLGPEDDSGEVQEDLAELEKKWSTFQMQVGQSKKSIELSIVFYKLVEEAEDWVKQGSKILVDIAGESANIQTPDQAEKLRSCIEHFLQPGEEAQQERITKISSLALQLYGGQPPRQVEVVNHQNTQIIDSFTVITRNLIIMEENLRAAEEHRENQKREKEELAASLAAAQAEAEAARLAAMAAEEARKAAEEVAKTLAIPIEPIVPQKVETEMQTEAIPLSDEEEPSKQEDTPPLKKAKLIDDEPQPMPPIFLTPLVGATVTEGVKFSFECKVLGMPMPEVEWQKDNMSITTNPDYKTSFEEGICTLTIEETFTEDSALFTCKAVNAAGMAETSAVLTVKEAEPVEVLSPPSFTKRLIDSTAQEGSTFQLEATVDGHPLPVVSWAKDGNCIDESPDYVITFNNGECVLRFEEVFLEDKAEYSCKATNELGEDVTKAKLSVTAVEVSERPKFTMPLSNVMARAGQKFKLECHVTGMPSPTVTWFHNTKPVKETPDCKITFDGCIATLVMSEAFPKNAGTYTVVAKNSAGEGQCSANVSVKGRIPTETSDSEVTSDIDVEPVKPTVQLSLKDTNVKEGRSARLDCVIIGQPEPEVIWYHDDKPVKESNDFKLLFHGDRCSLIIQEAFLEDAGIYRVVAMNSAGEASTACFLNVEPIPEPTPPPTIEPPAVAPRFSMLLADNHVTEGNPVTLRATVTGQPKPTIAWFRENKPLIPDEELQIHESSDGTVSATIHAASLDHTGQYEIVASNTAGTAKCVAYLSIEPRLPTPPAAENTEPPVFTKLITDTTVTSGGSVKFEAEVQGLPTPTVHWTLNDCPITGQEYLRGHMQYVLGSSGNTHTLELPTTSVMQAGRVAVIAENSVGKAVSAAALNIVEPPVSEVPSIMPVVHQTTREESHVTSSSSSTTMFQKSTIMETSHVTKVVSSDGAADEKKHSMSATSTSHVKTATGQPTVEVHGAHLQEMRQEGSAPPIVSDKMSLVKREGEVITHHISQDSGTTAILPPAKKIVISKKKSMPARFVAPLQGVITKEGDQIILECLIDGHPDPVVTWTHNGGPLSNEAQVKTHLNKTTVIIPRVNQKHSGHYTCLIENETGSAQCTCDVIVKKTQFPPVISKRLQPAVVGVNERLHLEIDVTGTPSPQVSWTKDGQPLSANEHIALKSEGTRHLLIIQQAEPGDSGRYGVIASNPAGRAESLADVMVTQLILDKAPPTHRMLFTDVTDEAKMFTSRSEEVHEEKRGGEGPKTTKPKPAPPPQQEKKPRFEEFRKETRGKPGTSSPYSEDTYYAMKDESDVATDTGRTQKKVEIKSETHVEFMSDKKVEVFESTSMDVSPHPSKKPTIKVEQKMDKKATEAPKIEAQQISKPFKPLKETKKTVSQDLTMKKSDTTFKIDKHVKETTKSSEIKKFVDKSKTEEKLLNFQPVSEPKVKQIRLQPEKSAKVPEIQPLKSTGLVKQAVTRQEREREELDLKPFPFKVEPDMPKKSRGAPPPQPSKFIKVEFHESDYDSDYEGRIPPKWKPSDSDADDQSYGRIKAPVSTPKITRLHVREPTPPTAFDEPPKFEGPPRPKVDFPESETEPEREVSPEIIIPEKIEKIRKPEPPPIVPKEPKIFKSQPQKREPPRKRSPSPVLKPGSPPIEDYVPPRPQTAPFSNAIGVESTKITKIADSSKHHQRFLTMQQTTRVIKFTDARTASTTVSTAEKTQESKARPVQREEPKPKPLPPLEPFPFAPEPEKAKKERGAPPPKPKKFQKGEFTESDYESDYEGPIKPKWQPTDSDADDISYNKVKPCLQSDRTPSKARERTPTPPTIFDTPPESGGPWRPIIKPSEIVILKEPSPEVFVPKELPKRIEPPKKITVKVPKQILKPVERPLSPPLPSPGPTPEEGIIVQETRYVVDKVDLQSRVKPPALKEIQTYEIKPYTKITERTEKTITNLKLEEELRIRKEKKETKKTIITESEQVPAHPKPPAKFEQTVENEKFLDLEPFPFEPDKGKPKRDRGPPPPKPKKFIKGEFRESDYDSDYESRVRPKWKPPESDAEDPEYTPVRPPPPAERHFSKSKDRTPTPPSKFEVPPASGGPLRPTIDPFDVLEVDVKEPSPEIIIPKVKEKPISKISKITPKAPALKPKKPEPHISKIPSPPLPEPGPRPEIGYIQAKAPKIEEKEDVHIKMIKKKIEAKKGFQIDIDITDIYDFVSESDHERVDTEHSQTKPFPQLVPFPYEPDPNRPKRQRGPPPPQPKKFMKGEFRGSDYESDYEAPIAPKWVPPDSEGEEHVYRRVAPPAGEIGKQRSESSGRDPSPPSKFDQPPHFEGPPRPVMDLSDLPRRERRESLEEYSIPRFPKVEFKPFDLEEDAAVHPQGTITTDTETETESHTKESIDRRYVKSAQKTVSHQFEDMTQTFRHKAQKFAEQLVTEVFAAREGSVPAEPAGEPPSLPEELRTHSLSPDSTAVPSSTTAAHEALSPSLQEPQAYRDESRVSEFVLGSPLSATPPSTPSTPHSGPLTQPTRPPYYIMPLRDLAIVAGEALRLECVVQADPPVQVTWSKGGIILQDGPDYQIIYRNGVCRLIIPQVFPEDEGVFTCTAVNLLGMDSTSATVCITGEKK